MVLEKKLKLAWRDFGRRKIRSKRIQYEKEMAERRAVEELFKLVKLNQKRKLAVKV